MMSSLLRVGRVSPAAPKSLTARWRAVAAERMSLMRLFIDWGGAGGGCVGFEADERLSPRARQFAQSQHRHSHAVVALFDEIDRVVTIFAAKRDAVHRK